MRGDVITDSFKVFAVSLAYFTFGYDGSVFGGVIAMPAFIQQFGETKDDGSKIFSSSQTSVLTAVPVIGAVLGLPLTAWMADRFGRTKTIMVGTMVGAIGGAMQVAASELALLTSGRAIASKFESMRILEYSYEFGIR